MSFEEGAVSLAWRSWGQALKRRQLWGSELWGEEELTRSIWERETDALSTAWSGVSLHVGRMSVFSLCTKASF